MGEFIVRFIFLKSCFFQVSQIIRLKTVCDPVKFVCNSLLRGSSSDNAKGGVVSNHLRLVNRLRCRCEKTLTTLLIHRRYPAIGLLSDQQHLTSKDDSREIRVLLSTDVLSFDPHLDSIISCRGLVPSGYG